MSFLQFQLVEKSTYPSPSSMFLTHVYSNHNITASPTFFAVSSTKIAVTAVTAASAAVNSSLLRLHMPLIACPAAPYWSVAVATATPTS